MTAPDNTLLTRLGTMCFRRRRAVVSGWIVLVALLVASAVGIGSRLNDSYTAGNTPSEQAQVLLTSRFPDQAGATADVVVRTTKTLDNPATARRVKQLTAALAPLPHVSAVRGPLDPAAQGHIAPSGHIAYIVVHFDAQTADLAASAVNQVISASEQFDAPGFDVAIGGAPIESIVSASPGSSETIGLIAAIIIMMVAFGSVVAMGLPIVTALAGVGAGVAAIALLSHLLPIATFGPEVMIMIGLGVGIDYALLVVTRYRQALAEGLDLEPATATALDTAGRSVLLAGSTVIIALLGLFLTGIGFMQGLAVATILAVLLVMAGSLTLLPAMFGFVGRSINRLHLPGVDPQTAGTDGSRWHRWSRRVQRHPWVCGGAALCALLILAAPALSLRMAFTDAGNDPPSLTTRQAYDLLADGFGPGANGPLILTADLPTPGDRAAFERLPAAVRATPGVASVSPARLNTAGDAGLIVVVPTTSPQSDDTASLVETLRDRVIPGATARSGAHVLVGGQTASGIDVSDYLAARTPWVIALVVGLAMMLLGAVFRSVLIPVKAAAMNLLSIGGAYGVMVAVFQWGWASAVFGATPGPIDPWIPLTMFTITFGLSMDYEVFLLSRIQEQWLAGADNSEAVTAGLAATGRVITAAAAIMICVFGSFVIDDPLHILDVFGLGLAASILIDATLVRMLLVPAVMQIAGRANWWFPRRLGRRAPSFTSASEQAPDPGLVEY